MVTIHAINQISLVHVLLISFPFIAFLFILKRVGGIIVASFGERLKQLRLEKRWTQQQMVDLFNKEYHYNLGKSAISQYENNKRIPEFYVLNDLADFLNVSLDYLFRGWEAKDVFVKEQCEAYRIITDMKHLDLEKMITVIMQLLRERQWFLEKQPLSKNQLEILIIALEIAVQLIKKNAAEPE